MSISSPSPSVTPASPELHYAPAPSRRRRTVRRIIFALLALSILAPLVIYRQPLWSQARLIWWQRACGNYVLPPDTIIAQTDPQKSTGLPAPNCWLGYQAFATPSTPAPGPRSLFGNLAFLHERKSKSGRRRIVAIRCIPLYLTSAEITQALQPIVVEPVAPFDFADRPKLHPGHFAGGYPVYAPLQLFAGQPDPNDDSHFTLAYTLNNQPGMIDGWLNDDDSVKLQLRPNSPTLYNTIRR